MAFLDIQPLVFGGVAGDFGPTMYRQKTEVSSLPTQQFDPLQYQQARSPCGHVGFGCKMCVCVCVSSLELLWKQNKEQCCRYHMLSIYIHQENISDSNQVIKS